jgi:hypothetical protein
VSHISAGSGVWLDVGAGTAQDLTINDGDEIVNLVTHGGSHSLSVIFSNRNGSNSSRWTKFDDHGNMLFERSLSVVPVMAASVDNLLVIISQSVGSSQQPSKLALTTWNSRYGSAAGSPIDVTSTVHPLRSGDRSTCFGLAPRTMLATSSDYVVLLGSPIEANSSILLGGLVSLSIGQAQCLLSEVIGRSSAPVTSATKSAAQAKGPVLEGLSKGVKRSLEEAQSKFLGYKATEAAYFKDVYVAKVHDKSTSHSNAVHQFKKYDREERHHLDIPYKATSEFLQKLQSIGDDVEQIDDHDWAVLKVLLASGTVSLISNPLLVSQATLALRIDILLDIAQYAPDLSERKAVELILLVGGTDKATLVRPWWSYSAFL